MNDGKRAKTKNYKNTPKPVLFMNPFNHFLFFSILIRLSFFFCSHIAKGNSATDTAAKDNTAKNKGAKVLSIPLEGMVVSYPSICDDQQIQLCFQGRGEFFFCNKCFDPVFWFPLRRISEGGKKN